MKKCLFFFVSLLLFHGAIAQTTNDDTLGLPSFRTEKKVKPAPVSKEKGKPRLFRGMIIVGANFTQIDGDHQTGYNKVGANVGGGLLVNLPKKFSVDLELLYSMKGALGSNDDFNSVGFKHTIKLDYIDLALMANYKLLPYLMFSVGLIPDVLVRQEDYFPLVDPGKWPIGVSVDYSGYRNFGMDGAVGLTGILKDHWALSFRFQYSIVIVNHVDFEPSNSFLNPYDGQMRHNIISLRAMYIF